MTLAKIIKSMCSGAAEKILAVFLLSGPILPAHAAITFTRLHSFAFSATGGGSFANLLRASDGNLYGTSPDEGVFKIDHAGKYSTLKGGYGSEAPLMQSQDGNLYGVTRSGGDNEVGGVFSMSLNGHFTPVYSFTTNQPVSGAQLFSGSGLVETPAGELLGTTFDGSSNGLGAIYQVTKSGVLTVLKALDASTGAQPESGLTAASDGNFYGVTGADGGGQGTLFCLRSNGDFSVVHVFQGGNEAGTPTVSPIQASDGNLYGTTVFGGIDNNGVIYRFNLTGIYSELYRFSGQNSGVEPNCLTEGSDGMLYGTTDFGGRNNHGTIFRLNPVTSAFTSLFSFEDNQGMFPNGLVQGADGRFYGTALSGGEKYGGTVFRVTIPVAPHLLSITATAKNITFTWNSVAGLYYQIQAQTTFLPNVWFNWGASFPANGGSTSATVPVGQPGKRSYRVLLLPDGPMHYSTAIPMEPVSLRSVK